MRRKKPRGKSACGPLTREFQQNDNTAPKNYDCDENDCAPFAPGSPTRLTDEQMELADEDNEILNQKMAYLREITYDSKTHHGFQSKTLVVHANTNPSLTSLRIKAEVRTPDQL